MTESHDIEEVLSSVRQLVAVEAGQSRTAARPGKRDRTAPLVLSATDRIPEPETPETPATSDRAGDRTGPLVLTRRADVPSPPDPADGPTGDADALPEIRTEAEALAEAVPSGAGASPRDSAPLLLQPFQTVTPVPRAPDVAAPGDEAALRALIAEVVREELTGDLGERMTRNLRRLVRREVQQALAAKRFD